MYVYIYIYTPYISIYLHVDSKIRGNACILMLHTRLLSCRSIHLSIYLSIYFPPFYSVLMNVSICSFQIHMYSTSNSLVVDHPNLSMIHAAFHLHFCELFLQLVQLHHHLFPVDQRLGPRAFALLNHWFSLRFHSMETIILQLHVGPPTIRKLSGNR